MSTIDPPDLSRPQIQDSPVLLALILTLAAAIMLGGPTYVVWSDLTAPKAPTAEQRWASYEASLPSLDVTDVAKGKRLYEASCIACHGPTARGVPSLGRDLVESSFSRRSSDADLAAMIARGRTTGDPGFKGPVPMPARGGRADFTDTDIASIVSYLRSLQVPSRLPSGELPDVHVEVLDGPVEPVAAAQIAAAPVAAAPVAAAPVAAAPVAESKPAPQPVAAPAAAAPVAAASFDPEVLKRGKRVYASCIACHGKDGAGVKGMGADLAHSAFVRGKSDSDLRNFIKTGRQPGAPDSVLNLNMPPKGGNPALKDNQIDDVVVFLRSLQQAAAPK